MVSIKESEEGTDTDGILEKNPIRYRGYYYDTETEFYNLNARYYDPKIRRFISADSMNLLMVATTTVECKNLYNYAENNPVTGKDSSGAIIETVWDIITLAGSITEVCCNPTDPWAWVNLAGDIADLTPFVTGIGEGIKGARAVAKAADKIDDAADAAKSAAKVVRKSGTSSVAKPNHGQGFSSKGYNPKPGERTLNGYVRNNANPEISLTTQSPGFNNNNGNVGGVFKRFGAESHGGVSPHVHQPQRNVAPNGSVYGSVGTKTSNGGVTSPSPKDVKQLYEYLNNGKYQ